MSKITREDALEYHRMGGRPGKVSVVPTKPMATQRDLGLAYTPGVAVPVLEIAQNPELAYEYTSKGNLVAVVSNGTAILGLGDRGALASKPVMEGKGVLFKRFADVDVFDIEVNTHDPDVLIQVVEAIAPTFGGINLEDIAAPNCFEIERRLKEELDIPVFHDDQHGTAVVATAALINAIKIVNKKLSDLKIVINGAGAAGIAITKLLLSLGVGEIILCDRQGAIYEGREAGMNPAKEEIARVTNRDRLQGSLADVIKGADVFMGVSGPNMVTKEMVASMKEPIIMAMANPVPEIMPADAAEAGARVVCTGRSDFPNQVNNVLAFPGIFRGALDVRARDINDEMKLAAAYAIAGLIPEAELRPDYVIPSALDERVAPAVAKAVAKAAQDSGVARLSVDPEWVAARTRQLLR